MNQLVFNQDGLSKAKTLMRYKPDPSTGMEDWNILYLLAESRFTAFARLVLTIAEGDAVPHVTYNRVGTSKRFVKYKPRAGNEHVPHTWRNGTAGSSFNMLYIPKAHPFADKEFLYVVFNYGGTPPVTDSKAAHKKSQQDRKETQPLAKHNKAVAFKQGILEALAAAQEAAEEQIEKVEERREVALVDSFTGNHVGGLKDDCGGAWITGIDARGGFGLAFKKLAQSDRRLFYGDKRQSGIRVNMSQYVSVAEAAAEAFVKIINEKFNLELYVRRYID